MIAIIIFSEQKKNYLNRIHFNVQKKRKHLKLYYTFLMLENLFIFKPSADYSIKQKQKNLSKLRWEWGTKLDDDITVFSRAAS